MRSIAFFLALLCVPASALACVDDDALAEAAGVLALEGRVDDDALRDALREVGTDLPSVRALEGDETSLTQTLRRLAREGDAPLVCGRASGAHGTVALVAWRGGALELANDALRVRLATGFSEARVLMQDADGQTNDEPVRDGQRLVIPDDLARPVRVQLLATGPAGPRPVAERTIVDGAGASGVEGAMSDEARSATNVASDEDLATRIAALRALAGVGELRDNRVLREAAAEHAARIWSRGWSAKWLPERATRTPRSTRSSRAPRTARRSWIVASPTSASVSRVWGGTCVWWRTSRRGPATRGVEREKSCTAGERADPSRRAGRSSREVARTCPRARCRPCGRQRVPSPSASR